MTIVLSIAIASILISAYFIRTFLVHRKKVSALSVNGIDTRGLLLEVRNIGLQHNKTPSGLSEIAVRFTTTAGKDHIIRHKKELAEGEVIPVGSTIDLTYLESDPDIFNIPSLGLAAQNKWTSLVSGIVILVLGLFIAYIVFINIGTV
ncbi:MAG: hypothetical protein ABS46_15210 [Cytophagaceae bacterium SCN 52-12]|nr:MAG: hypothetical protein ABS46_15210 [Cytophagaceae bacterium SCN 52-12]